MRTLRAVLLAIVATLALAGGFASTADAHGGPPKASATLVDGGDDSGGGAVDAGDPGIPPSP